MLRDELTMITGVCSNDINYIGYLLLKDGSYFKRPDVVKEEVPNYDTEAVPTFEQWFNDL